MAYSLARPSPVVYRTGISQRVCGESNAWTSVDRETLGGDVDAIETESEVQKQFFLALMNNKPADWRAIEVKFPE